MMFLTAVRVGLLTLAVAEQGAWAGEDFSIKQAELVPLGTDYVLNADIAYRFSAAAIDALENSVPLTLEIRCQVERVRRIFWNQSVADFRRRLQIRYHPLGQLFHMTYEDSEGPPQSYTNLGALLSAMGTIRRVPVVPVTQIELGATYRASLSVALDIESLPLPLRPTAYLSPSWYLSSPRYRWSFARSE